MAVLKAGLWEPRNQCTATYRIYKVWSTGGDISSAECPTTRAKLLICLFSFDCNASCVGVFMCSSRAFKESPACTWRPGVMHRRTSVWGSRDWEKHSKIRTSRLSTNHMSYAPDEGARRKCDANCNFTEKLLFLFLFLFFFYGRREEIACWTCHTLSETGWRKPHAAAFPVTNRELPLSPCSLCVLRKFLSVQFVHHNGWIGGAGARKKKGSRTSKEQLLINPLNLQ